MQGKELSALFAVVRCIIPFIMLPLSETGHSSPFNLQNRVGDILQRLGSTLSVEQQTRKLIESNTKALRGIYDDFDSVSKLLGDMPKEDLERTRKLFIGATQLFELLEDIMSKHIADRARKGDTTRLLQAQKEQHEVLVEVIDRIDDLLLSINLVADHEMSSILEKIEDGDMRGFIPRK